MRQRLSILRRHLGALRHAAALSRLDGLVLVLLTLRHNRRLLAKHTGGQYCAPPALQRDVQREPDSSDEEEERLLKLGADGK